MEPTTESTTEHLGLGETKLAGDGSRQISDLLAVQGRHALAEARRGRQRLGKPHRLGLLHQVIIDRTLVLRPRLITTPPLRRVERTIGRVHETLRRPQTLVDAHRANRHGHRDRLAAARSERSAGDRSERARNTRESSPA